MNPVFRPSRNHLARLAFRPRLCWPLLVALGLLACGPLTAQDLVPVNNRRAVSWGQRPLPDPPEIPLEELPPPRPEETVPQGVATWQEEPVPLEELEGLEMSPETPPARLAGARSQEIIRQRYPDGKIQIRRFVIQDNDGNFLNHGLWTLYSRQGKILAEGQFVDGLMNGPWKRWHAGDLEAMFQEKPFDEFERPFLSSCGFADGKQQGIWTVRDRQQRKILEIPYQQGQRHGTAVWYWSNGEKMRQAEFRNGRMQGELIEWDRQNRVTRRAAYHDNRELITRRTWFHQDQQQTEDRFLGPQLEFSGRDDWWNARPAAIQTVGLAEQQGLAQEWFRNGQLKMKGQYQSDLRQGPFMWWHRNGQKQAEGQFAGGSRDGHWTWWHDNGRLAIQGSYRDDMPIGQWTWWYDTGEIDHRENMEAIVILEELNGREQPGEEIGLQSPETIEAGASVDEPVDLRMDFSIPDEQPEQQRPDGGRTP